MFDTVVIEKTRNKWYLATNALYDDAKPYINWATLLPTSGGTKHQRAYLLASAKGLMSAMLEVPRDQKSAVLAHGTVINWFYAIKRLVHWMVVRDLWRFSALSPDDVNAYIEYCRSRENGKKAVSEFTFGQRIRMLQEMWDLRGLYCGALRVNPATLYIEPRRQAVRSTWKAIDEPTALQLLHDAIRWIREVGPYVRLVAERYWKLESKFVGVTYSERHYHRQLLLGEIYTDPEFVRLREMLRVSPTNARFVIGRAAALTEGACIVILLFLIGFRARELTRLDVGCLRRELDSFGNAVTRIHGIAAKQGGKSRTWIACEQVSEAVEYIESFNSSARNSQGKTALFATRRRGGLPSPNFRIRRIEPRAARERMVEFVRHSLSSHGLPMPRMHPHVARKTFARFVVLRDKSALESLSFHFGHVHRAITDGYYVGSDIELAKLIDEESRRDLAKALTDLLSAKHVGGKAGANISHIKSQYKFKGKKSLASVIEKLIQDGVQLAPCDWGYCVYSQALSACQGDSRGPNEARRAPDVCSACANFAVTEKHRAWWEARLARDDAFLARPHLPEQTVIWVSQRRSNTGKLLQALNGQKIQKKETAE